MRFLVVILVIFLYGCGGSTESNPLTGSTPNSTDTSSNSRLAVIERAENKAAKGRFGVGIYGVQTYQ